MARHGRSALMMHLYLTEQTLPADFPSDKVINEKILRCAKSVYRCRGLHDGPPGGVEEFVLCVLRFTEVSTVNIECIGDL